MIFHPSSALFKKISIFWYFILLVHYSKIFQFLILLAHYSKNFQIFILLAHYSKKFQFFHPPSALFKKISIFNPPSALFKKGVFSKSSGKMIVAPIFCFSSYVYEILVTAMFFWAGKNGGIRFYQTWHSEFKNVLFRYNPM